MVRNKSLAMDSAATTGRHALPKETALSSAATELDATNSDMENHLASSEIATIEEQTSRLASFPQLNPNPVLEVDSSGTITFANPATRNTLEKLGLDGSATGMFIPPHLNEILENWNGKEDATIQREIELHGRLFGETIFLTSRFGVARIYAFDITELKRAQDALAASEQRVRRKLESIISPQGDIGNLDLADIIDAPALQSLVDDFYDLTGMPMGLIDIKGKVLVGVGWKEICTRFHRIHPETRKNCLESDVQLSAGIPSGEYRIYKCRNNLWDVATPVMVGDRHFGNLFMGQFFFDDEPLDYEFFRSQAGKYGFDETEYIAALDAVPRLSRETLNTSMNFFMKLADILSKLSYSNLKLARSLAERDTLMESLRESEEQFRNMFERHNAVMLLIEPDRGAIVDANAAAIKFYGHSLEKLRGLKIQELNQLPPESVAAERQKALEEQKNHFVFTHCIATGEVRWVEVYSTPVVAQGKTLLFSVIHDITERKRAEEDLRRAKEAAEAATRTKSLFLANMSHELRTPMTGVIGMLDLVLTGNLEKEQQECIEIARTAASSMVRLLNDILDLTKIEMGKFSMEENPLSIRQCVATTYNILLPVARSKGLAFIFTVADDVPEALIGDQVRLNQVLTNLAGNAVKFTEKGEVALRVVSGGSTPGGKREITFTVTDTGIGIPEDKQHLLFGVFSQVDASHSRSYGGSGLGLAISREIVERMGGTIGFTSEAGKGSTFSCTIPFNETNTFLAARNTSTPGIVTVPEVAGKARLLVAEDDQVISKVLRLMFERAQFDVDLVDNGHKVLEKWETGQYDLILMDVQMPLMNGFDATAAIREKERTLGGHIPIIAVTAHALKEDEDRCLAAGMDAYISKPIDFRKSVRLIEDILKNNRS